MKSKYFYILLILQLPLLLKAQYITLYGNQLYDGNGETFYPVLLNYMMEPAFTSPTNFVLASCAQYGDVTQYDCSDITSCHDNIEADFAKIKDMGFNMIRPDFTPNWDPAQQEFYLRGWSFGSSPVEYRVYLSYPYNTDPNVEKYFDCLDTIAAIASRHGMLTMINGLKGNLSDPNSFTKYNTFLQLLGDRFENNTNIAFYDILSEPYYNYTHLTTKQQACELVRGWYDILKTADPNHLITGGNISVHETTMMDIGLTTLDFSQPHPYSYVVSWDGYDVTNMLNRIKGEMYWLNKNSPIAWIQGETSFRSSDTYSAPIVDGDNDEQQDYAEAVLAAARNAGAIGFVWWDYQDVAYPYPVDGYGLLKSGVVSGNNRDKPAVQTFQNYLTNGQPPAPNPALCVKPDNYYDPYLNGAQNTNHTNAVTGTVLDADNNPIEDAVIQALNWLYLDIHDPNDNYDDEYMHSWIYTFSDEDGDFEIIPYNYVDPNDNKIVFIRGSAVGTEIFNKGQTWSLPYGWTNVQMNPANVGTINLEKIDFQRTTYVSDITVNIGNTENFTGGMTLEVSDITVNGTSDFTAREEININQEFRASWGSEVHIYPSTTFSDCSDYNNFQLRQYSNILTVNDSIDNIHTNEIELQFKKEAAWDVSIVPNPSKGLFTVQFNTEMNDNLIQLKVRNLMGENLKEINIKDDNTMIDCSAFSKGIYILEINTDRKIITKKIIID